MDEYINNNILNNNTVSGVAYMFSGTFGVYDGSTTRPEQREKEHLSALANGRHWNISFQQAVDEHGTQGLCYIQYGPFPFDQLPAKEQGLFDEQKKTGVTVFNKHRPASKPHPVGYKLSAKTRKKQSTAKRGNKNAAKHFSFVSPSGTILETDCLTAFCKERGLDISAMSKIAGGKQEEHKGWQCAQ
jgi:hypothetical protein